MATGVKPTLASYKVAAKAEQLTRGAGARLLVILTVTLIVVPPASALVNGQAIMALQGVLLELSRFAFIGQ